MTLKRRVESLHESLNAVRPLVGSTTNLTGVGVRPRTSLVNRTHDRIRPIQYHWGGPAVNVTLVVAAVPFVVV